jgi:hypothetical protein
VVSGGKLFWADAVRQEVAAATEAAGTKWVVASGLAKPRRVAARGGKVYWSDELGNAIMRADEAGTASPELVSAANKPLGVAVDDSYVYWGDVGSWALKRAPAAGGTAVVLWQGKATQPGDEWMDNVAVDATHVYATRLHRYGSQRISVAALRSIKGNTFVASGGGELGFYDNFNSDISLLDGTLSVASFDDLSGEGLEAVTLFSVESSLRLLSKGVDFSAKAASVARGSVYTYWSDGDAIYRVPNCGGADTRVATIAGKIADLALGDGYLYFAVDNWIGRLALED